MAERARSGAALRAALERYDDVVAAQGVTRLPELDRWYHTELPVAIGARATPGITRDELIAVTEWKMARGVWRAPNLVLVRSNEENDVRSVSEAAFAAVPDPRRPIALLSSLSGIGPATASAVVAAYAPAHFPFFDELVAAQLGLGEVKWTPAFYARYAAALRERASTLGDDWTPATLERALWALVGGKAGVTP